MLIVAFEGGLGNQMFQYAFYKALKKYYVDIEVKADLSHINSKKHNGFELQKVFGIRMDTCKLSDVAKYSEKCSKAIKGYRILNFIYSVRRYLVGYKHSYIRQENSSVYYPDLFKLNALYHYYFKGVWANEKYFREFGVELREEFVFDENMSEQNRRWIELINGTESVSIHLRAGDYLELGYEVCDQIYYEKAIAYMKQQVKKTTFFVFSDDMEMAKKVLSINEKIYFVDNNKRDESYRDMQLMSMCKHNIVANSTFSFWGAYLNQNEKKIVVAPKKPAGKCKYPYACEDWILM